MHSSPRSARTSVKRCASACVSIVVVCVVAETKNGHNGPFPYPDDVPTRPGSSRRCVGHFGGRRTTTHPCAQQKSLTRRLSCSKKDLVAGAGFEPATFGL